MTALSEDFDYLAVELKSESTEQEITAATWEHEDLAQVKIKVFRGHTDAVNSCSYIDNDSKILSGSSDKTARIWDVEAGELRHEYKGGHTGAISETSINDNSRRFASCGWDKKVQVWDIESGNILWTGRHAGIVTCCRFSHDGRLLISGSDLDNTLKIWDSNSGDLLQNIEDIHDGTITSCIFSPEDDKVITTSMDQTCKFFDMRTNKITIHLAGHINAIADCDISFDERKFATASWDKSIKIWDVATGAYRSKGPGTLEGSHEGIVSCCQFSKDGLMLLSGSYDKTLCVWDVDNEMQKIQLQGHDDWIEDVAFSADQSNLLSASKDKTIRLWNVKDTEKIPVVLERKKAMGLSIMKCSNCGKPFSIAQMDSFKDNTICVFCRLENREKNMIEIMNSVKISDD